MTGGRPGEILAQVVTFTLKKALLEQFSVEGQKTRNPDRSSQEALRDPKRATGAAGESNTDVKLLRECPKKKHATNNNQHGHCIICMSAQVPWRVRQERLGYAPVVRGEHTEPIVPLPCVGRRHELRACYIGAWEQHQKAWRSIDAEVFEDVRHCFGGAAQNPNQSRGAF